MSTLEPLMAEVLPIPPLSLSGRVPPSNTVVTLDTSTAHADLTLWPEFHNGTTLFSINGISVIAGCLGVAAALRIGPATASQGPAGHSLVAEKPRIRVTRNWIIYNKTATQSKPGGEATHAG